MYNTTSVMLGFWPDFAIKLYNITGGSYGVIFWDFDGTLVHSYQLWSGSAWQALLGVYPGCKLPYAALRAQLMHGFPWHDPLKDYTPIKGDNWWPTMEQVFAAAYRACGISPALAAAAAGGVRGQILQPGRYRLYPNAINALRTCQGAGHTNVLLTNNYPEVFAIAAALGLAPYFAGAVVSAIEGAEKPNLRLFYTAMARYPADQYCMVGDNPAADLAGAAGAGIPCLLVHRTKTYAAPWLFDLGQVPGVIARTIK